MRRYSNDKIQLRGRFKTTFGVFQEELMVCLSAAKLFFMIWNSLLIDEQKGEKFSVPGSVFT